MPVVDAGVEKTDENSGPEESEIGLCLGRKDAGALQTGETDKGVKLWYTDIADLMCCV